MEPKEEINLKGIKITWKIAILCLVGCLALMCFFLGYMKGYNEVFYKLTAQHEDYIAKFCFCKEPEPQPCGIIEPTVSENGTFNILNKFKK